MIDSLLTNVAVFANANGNNDFAKSFLKVLRESPNSKFTFLALAQKLPEYARFPSANRKSRLEELFRVAANSAIEDLAIFASEIQLDSYESKILEGRFPAALLEWIDSSPASLILKESLACDGGFGSASKGDIKLTRQSSAPVLLAHSAIKKGAPVLVGIYPHFDDITYDRACIHLVETAAAFAKVLGSHLCVVHAWELWGENLIQSRSHLEEVDDLKHEVKDQAQECVERILSQSDLQGVTCEKLLGNGDATRVLSGAIDVTKPGLVVLGSTAKGGLAGAILGNTAETIARKKQSSVLIMR